MLYKRVELKEGNEVQYLGVYVLRWQREWGEPSVGFVETTSKLWDAVTKGGELTHSDLLDSIKNLRLLGGLDTLTDWIEGIADAVAEGE